MLNFQKFYFWYNNNLPLTVTDDMSILETLYKLTKEFNDVLEETEKQFNSLESLVYKTFQDWETRFQEFTTDLWNKFEEYQTQINQAIDDFETLMTNKFNDLQSKEDAFEERINNQYIDLTTQWNNLKTDWTNYQQAMTDWKNQTDAEIKEALANLTTWKNQADADINKSLSDMTSLYNSVNTGWATIQSDFANMQTQWTAFQTSVNTTINDFQTDLNDALGRITANEADITALQNNVGSRPAEFTGTVWDEIEQNHNDFESVSTDLTDFENNQNQTIANLTTKVNNAFHNYKLYTTNNSPTIDSIYTYGSTNNLSLFFAYLSPYMPTDAPGTISNYSMALYNFYLRPDTHKVETLEYYSSQNTVMQIWIRLDKGTWYQQKLSSGGGSTDFVKQFEISYVPTADNPVSFLDFAGNAKSGMLGDNTPSGFINISDIPSLAVNSSILTMNQYYDPVANKYIQYLTAIYTSNNTKREFIRSQGPATSSLSWSEIENRQTKLNTDLINSLNNQMTSKQNKLFFNVENIITRDHKITMTTPNIYSYSSNYDNKNLYLYLINWEGIQEPNADSACSVIVIDDVYTDSIGLGDTNYKQTNANGASTICFPSTSSTIMIKPIEIYNLAYLSGLTIISF